MKGIHSSYLLVTLPWNPIAARAAHTAVIMVKDILTLISCDECIDCLYVMNVCYSRVLLE